MNTQIIRIRGKGDMLYLVRDSLKQFLSFDDSFILRYNKNNRTCRPYIFHAEKGRSGNAEFEYNVNTEYPIDNDSITDLNTPVVQDVESLFLSGNKNVSFIHRTGIKEYVVLKLVEGNELIGLFVLLSENKNNFNKEAIELLEKLSYPISIATANIIANEDIVKREEEKTVLLSLSKEIAMLNNREDLFEVVNTRIKKLLEVEEFGIVQIDEGGETYSAFMLDFLDRTKSIRTYNDLASARYSVNDPLFTLVMNNEDPTLLDLKEMIKKPGMPGYIKFWKPARYKYYLTVPLRVGRVNIGFVNFHIDNPESIGEKKSLIKGICAQLAVAVSNILAKERIQARDEEKNLLLSLSNEIAALKNREDLSRVVNTKIKTLFSLEEFGIAQIDEGGETYSAFTLEFNYKTKQFSDYTSITSARYSVHDPLFTQVMLSEDPVMFDVAEIAKQPGMPDYVGFWKKAGFKYYLTVPLRVGGTSIGFVNFHCQDKKTIDTKSILLKGICAQLAVAVSNILANEEILAREAEKTRLLEFSNAMASVSDKQMLAKILKNQLNELFGIEDYVIHVLSKDKRTHRPILFDPEAEFARHPDFLKLLEIDTDVNDGVFNTILASEELVIFNVQDWFRSDTPPTYANAAASINLRQMAGVSIRHGQENIGIMNFKKDGISDISIQRPLFKSICSQIAIAVSNIMANEKILARNKEKKLLLSFSNEIAAVQSRRDLFKVVNGKIKQLFAIKQLGFSKIDEGGETYSAFLVDVGEHIESNPDFAKMVNAKFDAHEAVFKEVMNSEDPILYEVSDLMNRPEKPAYVDFLAATGIERIVLAPLRAGGVNIGTAQLILENGAAFDIKSNLLKGICSQLAVAISNILAAEKIRESASEKTKLLELSNAIASIHDKLSFLQLINTKLTKLFSFSHAMIACINEDKETCITYLLEPQGESPGNWDYKEVIVANIPLKNGVYELAAEGFVIVDLERFSEAPDFIKRNYAIGSVEMLLAPLKEDKNTIGFFMFFAKVKNGFDANQLNILSAVSHQLSIAAANIVANEKIQKQLEEIKRYKQRLEEENLYLQQEIETSNNHSDIVGTSAAIKTVFRLVSQVASSDSTVLLLGETGTGKELIARAIHNASPRKNKLMIKINCAALPANLIESELFGHERGSFTGAFERRIGKFELANNGTLFLDEIGEMPLELQVKLLRALQEKEIERIGGKTTIKTDVRIIAATNRDLEKLMEEGKFRSDLFYRLNIFPIQLPPLRKRREDIPQLASHFTMRFSKKAGKKITNFSNKALEQLQQYDWPGNIRELEHLIERSVLLTTGDTIKEVDLPNKKSRAVTESGSESFKIQTIFENEKEYILKILQHVNGRIAGEGGAAEILGIPPSTLNSRIKKLGIRREHRG
ncbi:sigma 54-interacting transcriptional regulator [Ferruginibacter paludis]|uniref:sigma 54-interacting transcriptional regulator n=1 Tax=Ferruginibacter paludis TaxID=1310417 RepID=UPI0025B32C84|nr:sigma 54-interacting transcriptional regulator [Ferruginibacter paludis]MDN3654214.1 sigma 54-interacting transcriptional regulator [Ferruginibacter paludis]